LLFGKKLFMKVHFILYSILPQMFSSIPTQMFPYQFLNITAATHTFVE
jgi:hypothetical protein